METISERCFLYEIEKYFNIFLCFFDFFYTDSFSFCETNMVLAFFVKAFEECVLVLSEVECDGVGSDEFFVSTWGKVFPFLGKTFFFKTVAFDLHKKSAFLLTQFHEFLLRDLSFWGNS